MEAYNHELAFTIDGEEIEITQGELHERAKKRAEDLQKQIDAAKRRGASADEIARLQAEADATNRIIQKTDPQRGKVDPDDLQDDLRQAPGLVAVLNGEVKNPNQSAKVTENTDAHTLRRMDVDANVESVNELADWNDQPIRSSVAGTIDESPFAATPVAPKQDFTIAATNIPSDANPNPDQTGSEPAKPTPGFNLG